MDNNPFAVLTAIVAPAILTNACSVLALGTSNRVARVVDRTRILTLELTRLAAGQPGHASTVRQLERMRLRARMLMGALRVVYAALGSFAACALVSVIGALATSYEIPFVFHASALVALLLGLSAVTCLVVGCTKIVAETRIALQGMSEDVSDSLGERVI